jgi:Ser/Thr protein kinase RdoA (MazF antagonist)
VLVVPPELADEHGLGMHNRDERLFAEDRNPSSRVGPIDFDHARPGAAVDDVAYARRCIAPLYDDDECLRWLRFQHAPNRRERILAFIRAYGLDDNEDWVALGLQMMRRTREVCARLADRGIQPQADWIAQGWLERDRREEQWAVEYFGAMSDLPKDAH